MNASTNDKNMIIMKKLTLLLLAVPLMAGPLGAADKKAEKAKPYPLKTCIVSGEEITDKGDMKPYSFVQDGQEVKLCCKNCLKDFKKDSAKYMAKIEAAQ